MGKKNGDIIEFIKQKDYIMINNNLGAGSFGKTVLLQDPFIDELFVAKKYAPEDRTIQKDFYQNFLDEIKILYKINHPNIVRIYNYYVYEGIYTGYILMEYINGMTLDEYFGDNFIDHAFEISLDSIFRQLISAFCYLEKFGIVHRDIRERNIMIQTDGTVKLIDFGIGKVNNYESSDFDSLASEINRRNVDILPDEYKQKVYTTLTDMFYIGELFNRHIRQAEEVYNFCGFSYKDILNKMMQSNPSKRYSSFLDIQEALDKHDFINLDISEKDKSIYLEFTKQLYGAITHFIDKFEFNRHVNDVLKKLENVIRNNSFETYIQNNSDIISIFVINGYECYTSEIFTCQAVSKFYNWLKSSTLRSQDLILSNIQTKLSRIKITYSDDEVPF